MLAHLPQREALYQVHLAVYRHKTIVAVLTIVAGQFLGRIRVVGGGVILAATVRSFQLPTNSPPIRTRPKITFTSVAATRLFVILRYQYW